MEEARSKLSDLFGDNLAVGDVEFSGDVQIAIDDDFLTAHLYTERDGDDFRLRFEEADIQAISERKGMALVPEQVAIVADYPLRAPIVLLLTDRARSLSLRHEPDDFWLRDAHRHVTWSFLLTERFGPEFATRVTDAQELRPGNTADERTMDFHNNAVGRRLVADGTRATALPEIVRTAPFVIRHPDQVQSFGEGNLAR